MSSKNTPPTVEWAEYYAQLGLKTTPIKAKSKIPIQKEWQQFEKVCKTPEEARRFYLDPQLNIGLVHEFSNTASLDVDHIEWSKILFGEFGWDLEEMLLRYPRVKSRAGRDKIIVRLPEGVKVSRKAISWPDPDTGEMVTVIEFRGGHGVQDVLPPSIHPDTLAPYEWFDGQAPWDYGQSTESIPMIDEPLLRLWLEFDHFRPQLLNACPWVKRQEQPINTPRVREKSLTRINSVIDRYNDTFDVREIIEQAGYKRCGNRWMAPSSSTKIPGVVYFEKTRSIYSHHGSDVLATGHAIDAFEAILRLQYSGDMKRAVKECSLMLGGADEQFLPKIEDEETSNIKGWIEQSMTVAKTINEIEEKEFAEWKPKADATLNNWNVPHIPGWLGDIQDFYKETAKIQQPLFELGVALALGATFLGRRFISTTENTSSLYLMCIAKSGTGKEHIKQFIDKVLYETGYFKFLAGDGYTSRAALINTLRARPNHISVIDEVGHYLEVCGDKKNTHLRTAVAAIMETFTRSTGFLQSINYAGDKIKNDEPDQPIFMPAVTIMGCTTPGKFFENISTSQVKDGFLGRFLILHSDVERQIPRPKIMPAVPQKIFDAIKAIEARVLSGCPTDSHGNAMNLFDNPTQQVSPIRIKVSPAAAAVLEEFEYFKNDLQNKLDKDDMAELVGRIGQIAHKISLILALSRDPNTESIDEQDALLAVGIVKTLTMHNVNMVRSRMFGSAFERDYTELLQMIESSPQGITQRQIHRTKRFRKMKSKDLQELLEHLLSNQFIRATSEDRSGTKVILFHERREEDFEQVDSHAVVQKKC